MTIEQRGHPRPWPWPARMLFLSALLPVTAMPADWVFAPVVELSAVTDDNYLLTAPPDESIDVTGGELDVELAVLATTPKAHFDFRPRFVGTYYPDDSEVETNNAYLTASAGTTGPRLTSEIDAELSRVTLVKGYLLTGFDRPDIGGPTPPDDIEELDSLVDKDQLLLAPSFEFRISPTWQADGRLEYLDVSYDDTADGGYVDFENVAARLGLGYRMNEVSTLSLRASGAWYEPDDVVVGDSTSYGVDLEWFTRQSETVAWYLRGGADITTTEDAAGNELISDETSFAGGAGMRWQGEVSRVLVDLESGVAPVWSGGVVQRDQLRCRLNYSLSPTWTAQAEIRGLRNRNLDSDSEDIEETYATGSVGIEWRFQSAWALRARYEYGNRDSDLFTDDAESNAFRLGVVYEPRRAAPGAR